MYVWFFMSYSYIIMQVFTWQRVKLTRDGVVYALHARRKYHGRPRYDFVHIRGGDDDANPWLARVLAIINVEVAANQEHVVAAGFLPLVIIQWLERDVDDIVAGTPSYHYLPHPQAVEVEAIVRPVKLLEYPSLDPEDGTRHLCALLHGKTAAFNDLY